MELAGLEPAASWVRSRRSPGLSVACLQGFRGAGARPEARTFRLISAHFGWDRGKGTGPWHWTQFPPQMILGGSQVAQWKVGSQKRLQHSALVRQFWPMSRH